MKIDKFTNYKVIFWDFDGTIKESSFVKNYTFERLFQEFGDFLIKRIKLNHIENEEISRFVKIPKYMQWAGIDNTEKISHTIVTYFLNL
jgi:beta-phosphoglucomutase-like phosphatase (HAD superfamily)